jgi:hypothetical protein
MAWPPYELVEPHYLRAAQEKYEKLERLYHVAQDQAWDGKQLLQDLIKKHGKVSLPPEQKKALGVIFSTILWGELAAWSISADLALSLDNIEAKMAATSQTFDEARHFYVMRDYLAEFDYEVPRLDGYTHTVLTQLLDTPHLADKLLGMQLIVESVALQLFRSVAAWGGEPVLAELLTYFERDEARHVGLGVLYLPPLLEKASVYDRARLVLLQMRIITHIAWGTNLKEKHFRALGIDNNENFRRGFRLQQEVLSGMRRASTNQSGHVPRGIVVANTRFNNWAIDLFFPRHGSPSPAWHRTMMHLVRKVATLGDQALKIGDSL